MDLYAPRVQPFQAATSMRLTGLRMSCCILLLQGNEMRCRVYESLQPCQLCEHAQETPLEPGKATPPSAARRKARVKQYGSHPPQTFACLETVERGRQALARWRQHCRPRWR